MLLAKRTVWNNIEEYTPQHQSASELQKNAIFYEYS